MQKFAKLFLPLVLIFLAAFAHKAAAVNTVAVNPAAYTVNENSGQTGVVVSLTREPGNTQVVMVNFATSNGTAIAGSDFFGASGTLTFAANESVKLIQLSVINDFLPESSENFFLTLSNAVGATITAAKATITITDDDGSPDGIDFISFSSADYGTVETLGPGRGPGVINLVLNAQRRGDPNRELVVEVTLTENTAKPGIDYLLPTTTIYKFPAGVDQIVVPVVAIDRPNESQGNTFFTAVLTSTEPFISIGQPASARCTIFDNDVGLIRCDC